MTPFPLENDRLHDAERRLAECDSISEWNVALADIFLQLIFVAYPNNWSGEVQARDDWTDAQSARMLALRRTIAAGFLKQRSSGRPRADKRAKQDASFLGHYPGSESMTPADAARVLMRLSALYWLDEDTLPRPKGGPLTLNAAYKRVEAAVTRGGLKLRAGQPFRRNK